jgi:hypothetical protein
MEFDKIFGWILIFIGLLIILWTLFYSFNVFQGKSQIPEIFKMEKAKENSYEKKLNDISKFSQQILEEIIIKEMKNLFPIEFLPKFLNLISFSIFAGLFIFGGSQIASLGIKMIKNGNKRKN